MKEFSTVLGLSQHFNRLKMLAHEPKVTFSCLIGNLDKKMLLQVG